MHSDTPSRLRAQGWHFFAKDALAFPRLGGGLHHVSGSLADGISSSRSKVHSDGGLDSGIHPNQVVFLIVSLRFHFCCPLVVPVGRKR